MNEVTERRFTVQKMKCQGCVARAREALARLDGFVDAEFDLAAGTAVVRGDVDPDAVVQALTGLGYPAAPAG